MRRRNPVQSPEDQARELADYLNIVVDPYDFGNFLLEQWQEADEEMQDFPTRDQVEDLSEEEQARFAKWLKTPRPGQHMSPLDEEMQDVPTQVPAYLYFENAKPLGPGAWCVHFSRHAFSSFDRGATLERLALSTHWREKAFVKCEKNLEDDIGLFERVFGFAFSADGFTGRHGYNDLRDAQRKYGREMVLFQTDAGVEAYHVTDEEHQVIFPLCSEYDVHAISLDGGEVLIHDVDDTLYPSLDDAIERLEHDAEREKAAAAKSKRRANPARRPEEAIGKYRRIDLIEEPYQDPGGTWLDVIIFGVRGDGIAGTDKLAQVAAARKPGNKYFEIMGAQAVHGWGPLAYDILMERATELGGALRPDPGDVTREAIALWSHYETRRPDVVKIPVKGRARFAADAYAYQKPIVALAHLRAKGRGKFREGNIRLAPYLALGPRRGKSA